MSPGSDLSHEELQQVREAARTLLGKQRGSILFGTSKRTLDRALERVLRNEYGFTEQAASSARHTKPPTATTPTKSVTNDVHAGENPRASGTVNRIGPAPLVAAAWVGAFAAWVVLHDSRDRSSIWISNTVQLATCIVAAMVCWRAYRRDAQPGASVVEASLGRGWLLVSGSLAAWSVGQILWTISSGMTDDLVPFGKWPDLGFVVAALLLSAALFCFPFSPHRPPMYLEPARPPSLLALTRAVIDAGLITIGLLLATISLLGDAIIKNPDWGTPLIVLALFYPTWGVFNTAISLTAIARYRARLPRALVLVTAGIIVWLIADCLFLYQTGHDTYYNGGIPDIFWVAAFATMGIAAWSPQRTPTVGVLEFPLLPTSRLLLPYFAVCVSLWVTLAGGNSHPLVRTVSSNLVVALVTLRQYLLSRENNDLGSSLRVAARAMEEAMPSLSDVERSLRGTKQLSRESEQLARAQKQLGVASESTAEGIREEIGVVLGDSRSRVM